MNGFWQWQYWGGTKWKEGNMVNDKKHGFWKYWYESTKPLMEGNFNHDLEEGEWKSWYENGYVQDIGNYKHGQMNGHWTGNHPNGVKSYDGEWSIVKSKDEFAQTMSDLYKIKTDTVPNIKSGDVKKGKWTYWNDKGGIEKIETYGANGALNGPYESYNLGRLDSKGSYKNGKPHGKWSYFHPHGAPMRDCTYKEGKLNGKSVIYDARGRVIEESNYLNNKLHGTYISYDEKTGKEKIRIEYENGKAK
jgi:antitoxin component YwqK of YwqJK toxin-antitoxin module